MAPPHRPPRPEVPLARGHARRVDDPGLDDDQRRQERLELVGVRREQDRAAVAGEAREPARLGRLRGQLLQHGTNPVRRQDGALRDPRRIRQDGVEAHDPACRAQQRAAGIIGSDRDLGVHESDVLHAGDGAPLFLHF